jgi:hypothetical protein
MKLREITAPHVETVFRPIFTIHQPALMNISFETFEDFSKEC